MWTYSADPSLSHKDAVRFLVGDVDESEQLVQDEEIQWQVNRWYELYGTLEYVAAKVCETIAARFAREAPFAADGVSISLAALQQQFAAQAVFLRQQHKDLLVGGVSDAGGVTAGEEPDPDIADLNFGTGMHDNHEAGQQDFGRRHYHPYTPEYYPGT